MNNFKLYLKIVKEQLSLTSGPSPILQKHCSTGEKGVGALSAERELEVQLIRVKNR
jgi:hypothetical protein